MRPLLVFGAGSFAALLARSIQESSSRIISGFVVDLKWRDAKTFDGKVVFALEELRDKFAQDEIELVLPVGFLRINGFRAEKFKEVCDLGFKVGCWLSSHCLTPSDFHLQPNVLIYEHAIIQQFVSIGENTIIRAGANIGHHTHVGKHVFIASGAVTGGNVRIGDRCCIGLGAVIRDNITLAPRTFVGAGAVVTQDTEADGVYVGVPARRLPNKTAVELTS